MEALDCFGGAFSMVWEADVWETTCSFQCCLTPYPVQMSDGTMSFLEESEYQTKSAAAEDARRAGEASDVVDRNNVLLW